MKAPNPIATMIKALNVTQLVRVSKKKHQKFQMLMDCCIGKAAADVKEFYLLPVGDKLMQYDSVAVNTIVKNKDVERDFSHMQPFSLLQQGLQGLLIPGSIDESYGIPFVRAILCRAGL